MRVTINSYMDRLKKKDVDKSFNKNRFKVGDKVMIKKKKGKIKSFAGKILVRSGSGSDSYTTDRWEVEFENGDVKDGFAGPDLKKI